jgi:hypothetical protein
MKTKRIMSESRLREENAAFAGTAGTSEGCAGGAFKPAFFDFASCTLYLSRFADGRLAPIHVLDGLPAEVLARGTLIYGFERNGFFYTRRAAARACEEWRV